MESKFFLNNIKSKYNLKQVFLYSYFDFKSVLKLIKYNKSLQKKLGINIKDCYCNYKYQKQFEKNEFSIILSLSNIIIKVIMLVFFFIYLILFYVKGSFIDENIKKNCDDKNKIRFIEIMNNNLYGYLIFLLISILWYVLCLIRTISFKVITRLIIFNLILLIDLFYYILLCIKYNYSNHIIFDIILKDQNNIFVDSWFINMDFLILLLSPIFYIALAFFIYCIYKCNFNDLEDQIIFKLNQFKDVNIIDFPIRKDFRYLNIKEINKIIFENARNYKYKLKENQIDLIGKINEIRRKNNIPLLSYDKTERIPHFIINGVTEEIFDKNKNNFKLKSFLYLFRYKKNEFQNFIETDEILSVITNDLFNKIKIIEQNNIEYILIYNVPNPKNIQNLSPVSHSENEVLENSDRQSINS